MEINYMVLYYWKQTIRGSLPSNLALDLQRKKTHVLHPSWLLEIKCNLNVIRLPTLVFLNKYLIISHFYFISIILSSIIGSMSKTLTPSQGKVLFPPWGQTCSASSFVKSKTLKNIHVGRLNSDNNLCVTLSNLTHLCLSFFFWKTRRLN